MVKKVLKFGGTSVGTIERIQHVANIIQKEHSAGNQVIAVVSAMSGKTNELINLSKDISKEFNKREFDVLLSSSTSAASVASSKIWLPGWIEAINSGKNSLFLTIGPGDFLVHHAIALGLHTTTLILVKGALDARG